MGLKVRGSSTAGRPKPSLSLEAWGELDEEKGITPLGLPRESDWILWGPYNFDLTLMHNPFIYELSNQIGRYAPRTRFVEVFLNTGGGPLRSNDYFGVYALTEKIKRDDDRVSVSKLFPEHDRMPNLGGGYLLKIDRADPGDSGFSQAGQRLRYVYPKEVVIERPEREAQERFLRDFFRDLGRAVNGSQFRDPERGYARYIDVGAAIDHHLLNVLAFNVDALRLSGYMHLPRGGKLTFGPIWDFDRALGSTDGRDLDPTTWRGRSGDRGTDFFNYPWWNRMFRDPDFFQRYIDRYQALRQREFRESHLNQIIDGMAAELREAQVRNLQRWNQRPRSRYGGHYRGEVEHMKDWLAERMAFMDSQFVSPPSLSHESGRLGPETRVSMTAIEGSEIYYTIDGSDPRLSGGKVSPAAFRYSQSLQLDQGTQLIARVRHADHRSRTGSNNPPLSSKWSGPVRRVYSLSDGPRAGDLVINEIHYHPLPPTETEKRNLGGVGASDFEFIELRNVSRRSMDLTGLRLLGGIRARVSGGQLNLLGPGAVAVFVSRRDAFVDRYGAPSGLVYEFRGALDNDRDQIVVETGSGDRLDAVSYDDSWYPSTDGLGFSIIFREGAATRPQASGKALFRPSGTVGGSPGRANPEGAVEPAVRVSEVWNNSTEPQVDAIELVNQASAPIDVGGWFLTDNLQIPNRYQIPRGTVLGPNEFFVIDETQFGRDAINGNGFALGSAGDEIYLMETGADGTLTGYIDGFRIAPSPSRLTQGRWIDSVGRSHIVPFARPTIGRANAHPFVGRLVISEIYSAPTRRDDGEVVEGIEFVEVVNRMDAELNLSMEDFPSPQWRLRGGIDFDFPSGTTLKPKQVVVVVPFDPDVELERLNAFREHYSVPDGTSVLGPFRGRLENAGEAVRLERRDPSLRFESNTVFFTIDQVSFGDETLLPVAPGLGHSIERVALSHYGTDASNWLWGEPSPGLYQSPMDLRVVDVLLSTDGVRVMAQIPTPGEYRLESSGSLAVGSWKSVQDLEVEVLLEGAGVEFLDSNPASDRRFYRVVRSGNAH